MNLKVAFLVEDLNYGGIARVVSTLALSLSKSMTIEIIVLHNQGNMGWYDNINVPKRIILHDNRFRLSSPILVIKTFIKTLNLLRVSKYDCVISSGYFASSLNGILMNMLKIKTIAIQHADPEYELKDRRNNFIIDKLFRTLLKRMDCVVAVSSGIASTLTEKYNISKSIVKIINNPLDITSIRKQSIERLNQDYGRISAYKFISMGRLSEEKNFPLLLSAFKRLHNSSTNISLMIIGEGSERRHLEELIARNGQQSHVNIIGFKRNPYKYLRKANCFISSSKREGFGNVIVEAMACNLPVIATKTSGAKDIIFDDRGRSYGIVVEQDDEIELAEEMLRLMKDKDLNNYYISKSQIRCQNYDVSIVSEKYRMLICNLVNSVGN